MIHRIGLFAKLFSRMCNNTNNYSSYDYHLPKNPIDEYYSRVIQLITILYRLYFSRPLHYLFNSRVTSSTITTIIPYLRPVYLHNRLSWFRFDGFIAHKLIRRFFLFFFSRRIVDRASNGSSSVAFRSIYCYFTSLFSYNFFY